MKATQVSEELGVQYVLDGSVQKAGDRVRVTAQLIDALTGHHLWSERYDRRVKDIFDLQDDITMKILTELRVKITEGEAARISAKGTSNLQAYLKVIEANWYRAQYNKEAGNVAKRFYNEAVDLDPNYVMPYVGLAITYMQDLWLGASESPGETLSNGMKMAKKALTLDDSSAEAHAVLGYTLIWMRQHDRAVEVAEQAVKLDPNSTLALYLLGMVLNYSWRAEEALPLLQQVYRLNPNSLHYDIQLAVAYRDSGRSRRGDRYTKEASSDCPS